MQEEEQGFLELYLSGADVFVKDCNIVITPPAIRQIAILGETNFLYMAQFISNLEIFVKVLREGNSILAESSDFQLLLVMLMQEPQLKNKLQFFLELICPMYDSIEIADTTINFKIDAAIKGQLNPMNFFAFQQHVKGLFIPQQQDKDEIQYNPANEKAKEIMDRIKDGRERVKKIKAGDKKISLFSLYTSVLSIGLGIDINTLFNYTPFQLYDSFQRYVKKLAFDQYQKVATTPLIDVSSLKEPDNWIDGLY